MPKKIFNCRQCQKEYDNLKDWEVKKRDWMERDADNYCLNKHQGIGSFVGREELCSECKNAWLYNKGNGCDDYDPNWKPSEEQHSQAACLQLQKEKLERLRKNKRNGYTLTPEDQAELARLEQKLGVAGTPNYSPASEENKKELENQINTLLKGQKAWKQLPENHPSFSEYDRQLIEERLNKLKKEYSYKYGELPASLRDDNYIERERETNPAITEQNCWVRGYF
ncbi:MAG: hypothetical protein MRERV_43c011 [Mycoplasmataceae bacterium RV_VA103A]|nr:MAG: hypothetical protein MRERV_43c011 [Mycoplasmataceae bacterium RV_VA103A]